MSLRNVRRDLFAAVLAAALLLSALPGPAIAAETDWQARYWNNRLLTGTPALTRTDKAISFDWGFGSPAPAVTKDNWSARWVKSAEFTAGWYRFRTFTDDGVRLWVDGRLVIDQWFDLPGAANTADVYLTAGAHEIKMEYFEHLNWARAYLTWTRFSGEPEYTGWKGEYFNNRNLSGDPAFIRDDAKIDFDWGWDTVYPGVGLTEDNFSIRWTRRAQFEAGTWRFKAAGSDGFRVFVDGQKILDSWREQELTNASAEVYLAAGPHDVKVEYFEGRGQAVMRLEYERTSGPPSQPTPAPATLNWRGEYYPNRYLTGAPVFVRDDAALQFNWGAGSPGSGVPDDRFSVRWTRATTFAAGTYRFYSRTDDGVRLWVDNALVIDQWNDQAATTHYGDAALSPGSHLLRLEYYENMGAAEISLWWESISASAGLWLAEYFSGTSLEGAPVRSERVNEIQFDWGSGSPGAGVSADQFSARFTQTAAFTAGLYAFRLRSDDGARLWVDDQLVLDRWVARSATDDAVTVQLAAGSHPIRLEYFEESGLAELRFSWEKASNEATLWTAQYFSNRWLIGYPTLVRTESALDFNWGTGSPAAGIPADDFSARWTRTLILANPRTLTFALRTDDGARLWVDNALVLDKWYDQAATSTFTALVPLAPGAHTIMLEYYERSGLASAYLSWQ